MRLALLCGLLAYTATAAPLGWIKGNRTPPGTLVQLTVGVKHSEAALAELEEAFWAVSDPSGPRWSQHLTQQQVDDLVRPDVEYTSAVMGWLSSCGVAPSVNGAGDWVTAVVTVECAEGLLGGVQYHQFNKANSDGSVESVHRVDGPLSLPASVRDIVTVVEPTNAFPAGLKLMKHTTAKRDDDDPFGGTTPTTIRTAYKMGSVQANNSATGKNSQQAAGFLGQYADPNGDLQEFFGDYYPAAKGRKFTVVGPNQAGNAGDEASLDTQYIMAIGSNVETVFWSTKGERPYANEPYLVWLTNVTALPDNKLPNTISVSYGDNEWQIVESYAAAVDVEFQKLGVRGTSVIFASGDGGVSGGQAGPCLSGDRFVPTWPAGDNYVTSVGATDLSLKKAASFSSGGFSNVYPAQKFQQAAIAQYKSVAKNLPTPSHYNATGRGFPDVCTVGAEFWIYVQGLDEAVDGTSCAAPTFTGIISLLNDARIGAGKRPLGYLNQLLYANPGIFTDITEGSNPGCGTNGFTAAVGWDPITGLGSPDYPKMLALAMSLP